MCGGRKKVSVGPKSDRDQKGLQWAPENESLKRDGGYEESLTKASEDGVCSEAGTSDVGRWREEYLGLRFRILNSTLA